MLKRSLQDMFEKVNGVKLSEGWFSQGNKTPAPMQGTQAAQAPVPNPQKFVQDIFNGVNKMGSNYVHYFVTDVTGGNHAWANNFNQWIDVAVKKVAANPKQYAEILHKYPQIEQAVNTSPSRPQ